jgi:hypothetical protein
MQHGEEANIRSETPWVGGNLQQGVGNGPEHQGVEDPGILQGYRRQTVGHCKDYVKILHWQQLGLPSLKPLCSGQRLTLGTVAIPARVVDWELMCAGVALIEVTTESGRPALLNRLHYFVLEWRRRALCTKGLPVQPKNIGDF